MFAVTVNCVLRRPRFVHSTEGLEMNHARLLAGLACFFVASVITACTGTTSSTRFDDNTSLFKGIEKADLTALYEGLPRGADKTQFSGQTTTIHDYPFFSTP